ncbi:MAG: MotA/TolQ/ExbB proton channel family protein [Pseudomonadota bacterium]
MTDAASLLRSGGPIVWQLLVLSVLSLAVIVTRIMQLRGVLSGAAARSAAIGLWASGDRAAAIAALPARAPADRVLKAAMEAVNAGGRRAAVEPDLEWRGNEEVTRMSRHIRLLELIAMVAPLLGLLGTVLGMISAFQSLAAAEGAANASLLAGGIWEALLTTAAGLMVAIPAAIAAGLLAERVDRAAQMIEAAVGQFFAADDARR